MSAGWPEPPEGFRKSATGRGALYAAEPDEPELLARGLDRGETWERLLARGGSEAGRGASVAAWGWRLKKMRRGGVAGRMWRDRYPSPSRLVTMLSASGELARRDIPTPRAVALLVEREGGRLVRGFFATEEIDGAEDLARRVVRRAATRGDIEDAMRAVRVMHDRGVDHPDLNLANLLVVPAARTPRIHVIDLDRVRLGAGPVSAPRRRRALRRIERSCAKLTGDPGPLGPGSEELWYEAYGLAGSRPMRRLSIAMHRLLWKGGGR